MICLLRLNVHIRRFAQLGTIYAILKSVKNTHGKAFYLVKLKITLLHGCFSRFLNLTNGTKLRKASHIHSNILEWRVICV